MVQESKKLKRILFQTRPTAFSHRGGDTTLLERYSKLLEARGFDVTVDVEGVLDPAAFDIVHLFNFAIPQLLETQAKNVFSCRKPFVITTLSEDIARFHASSHAYAAALIEYVKQGQRAEVWSRLAQELRDIKPVPNFDNTWTVGHASALLVNGSQERAIIEKQYGKKKNIRVVPVGFDMPLGAKPDLFQKEYQIKDFVLCVGRLESRKNQLMLLKALEHTDVPLVLAGSGFSYQPEYEQAIRSFKRSKGKTLILGRLSDELLASAYAACKVHVLPSWCELPGLVSLEAAWHGANVVACDNGTVRDYLGDHAFYCEPDNEHSILQATLAAYYSPSKREKRSAVEMYTWAKSVDALVDAYQEAVEGYTVPEKENSEKPTVNFSEVDELIEQGEEAAYKGRFEEAHRLLLQAVEKSPDNVRAARACGAVFFTEENIPEAKKWFEKACTIKRNDPKALSGLGMCHAREGGFATAHELFVKSLRFDPYHVVTIAQLVDVAYKIGWFDELAEALERYLEARPDDTEMQFCLAGALYKLERLSESLAIVQQILGINPDHKGSQELHGLLLQKLTPAEKPRQSTTSATATSAEIKPELVSRELSSTRGQDTGDSLKAKIELLSQLGTLSSPATTSGKVTSPNQSESLQLSAKETRSEVKDSRTEVQPAEFEEAQAEINLADEDTTKSAETALVNANATEALTGDFVDSSISAPPNRNGSGFDKTDERLAQLEDEKRRRNLGTVVNSCQEILASPAITVGQRHHAKVLLAETYILEGRVDEASEIYNSILLDDPSSARALCGKGALSANAGKWDEAESLFHQAYACESSYDVSLAGLGLCAHRRGEHTIAWDWYLRALERNPENTRALLGVVELGYALGRLPEVERVIKLYLEHHPADLDFLYSLAGCYYAQEKFLEAQEEIERITLFDPGHERARELEAMVADKLRQQTRSASA